MKRVFTIAVISLVLLIALGIGALYWALQGQYASVVINKISEQFSLPVSVYDARFQFPNHISLTGVEIKGLQEQPVSVEKMEIWLTPASLLSGKPVIESLLLDGLSLQHGIPKLPELSNITLKQLAIKNLDYSEGELIGRDINLQVENPVFTDNPLPLPYGKIQLSAGQIYWKGEAFDAFLADANYYPADSKLYGLSFDWRNSKVSGQAQQLESGWSLVNFTVNGLRLNKKEWHYLQQLGLNRIRSLVSHINSIDLLKCSLETPTLSITNFDLSAEELDMTRNYWSQQQAYMSLDAESINVFSQQFVEPAFEIHLEPGEIKIADFHTGFYQGDINASGSLKPDDIQLQHLTVNGLKWIPDSPEETRFLTDYLTELNSLSIDEFKIKHSQLIQLNGKHKWQISGLNLDGRELTLIQNGKWALWKGKADISANNASFNEVVSEQPIIRMQNRNGVWQLDDLFIPLQDGLITAAGSYNMKTISQPWRLEMSADGLPVQLLSLLHPLPVDLSGLAEFQLSASGLGGDRLMLDYSLSSELVGSVRNAAIKGHKNNNEEITYPVDISEIHMSARRGNITLHPLSIKGEALQGQLTADIDLVEKQNNTLKLTLRQQCQEQEWDLLRQSESEKNLCEK